MRSGLKPLSVFVEDLPRKLEIFPENDFDALVSEGKLKKHIITEQVTGPSGEDVSIRKVFYALPGEEWRIHSFLLVQSIYDSLVPGWRPDLDRVIGALLGYDRADIEKFVQQFEK